jgi:hypothetical protein
MLTTTESVYRLRQLACKLLTCPLSSQPDKLAAVLPHLRGVATAEVAAKATKPIKDQQARHIPAEHYKAQHFNESQPQFHSEPAPPAGNGPVNPRCIRLIMESNWTQQR